MTQKCKYLEDWLSAKCESTKTLRSYLFCWENFADFAKTRGLDANRLVEDYRAVKYESYQERERFLEVWQDTVRSFYSWLKKKGFAPLTAKNHLATLRSFFSYWDIPLKVELPRHSYVMYHNRDLTKEEVRQILTFASARDRVIFLVMAESGMRVETTVNLKYWQIKEDFEAQRIPMKILLPSESLKDHVGDRWTFIGDDGYRELRNYLQRRLPLEDDDYVFASEKEGKVKGEQFTPASLTVKFNRLVQKLGIDKSIGKGKPKRIRLHGLRKYFRNNMKADSAYVRFWMGHSLGTDAHYISRDVEEHRKRYKEGYPYLKIFEPSVESIHVLYDQIRERDEKIQRLIQNQKHLEETVKETVKVLKMIEEGFKRHTATIYNFAKTVAPQDRTLHRGLAELYHVFEGGAVCEVCETPILKDEMTEENVKIIYDREQGRLKFYHAQCYREKKYE
ncbi:tyrosine-type recombinase/integrase [Candidatus Bathyarchaeota archaeon]|nr:tyrosine-type recombinase/integrase [Candidatus Bathyarchaeota archaeon]